MKQALANGFKFVEQNFGIVYYFLLVMAIYLILSLAATHIPDFAMNTLDIASSYLVIICLVCCAIIGGKNLYNKDKNKSRMLVAGCSATATCYLGYVLFNYGAIYPHISAVGFNIATILMSIALFSLCFSNNK